MPDSATLVAKSVDFRINGQPQIEVPVGTRVPELKVRVVVEIRTEPIEGNTFLYDFVTSFDLLGIRVPQVIEESGIMVGTDLSMIRGSQISYRLLLPRSLIEQIESFRDTDVSLNMSFQARYLGRSRPAPNTMSIPQPQAAYVSHSVEISESKWLGFLEKMGYFSAWLIEIPRPKIEGWDEAVKFLKSAEERILSHDPEGAVAACRATWKSVQKVIEDSKPRIALEIDRGSRKEEGEPEKSERIENIWRWVLKFSNVGSHPEYYAATMEDAKLAYQTTCSVLSYISRKYVDAEKHRI